MDTVLARIKKGKKYLTDILDPYPEAMMLEEPIYSNHKTKVYKIEDTSGEYILKTKDFHEEDNEGLQKLQNEYDLTKKLGSEHSHFIRAIDIKWVVYSYKKEKRTRVEILLEYGGPDLKELMNMATDKEITMWMLQSLSALLYSEKLLISHFGIQPENMVYRNGILKIIDMGTAVKFTKTISFYEPIGEETCNLIGFTRSYAPPEVTREIDLDSVICGKVDAYCWAMSLYQIITKIEDLERLRVVDKGEDEYNKFLEDIKNNNELAKFDKKKIVTKVIIGCLKYKPEDRLNFENVQELLVDLADEEYEEVMKVKNLYYSIGCSYMDIVNNKDLALKYFLKEINIYEKIFIHAKLPKKYEIDKIGFAYNKIGEIYYNKVEYKNALSNYEKALNIRKKILGEEHSDIADTHNNIGCTCDKMGDYKNALINYEKALNIKKKVLGEEHSSTATTYYNIAATYYSMGDYKNAIIIYEKVLIIRKKVLGEDNSNTATAYYNIGLTYDKMYDYKNALINYQKALSIRKKVLGDDHPDTKTASINIKSAEEKMNSGTYKQTFLDGKIL